MNVPDEVSGAKPLGNPSLISSFPICGHRDEQRGSASQHDDCDLTELYCKNNTVIWVVKDLSDQSHDQLDLERLGCVGFISGRQRTEIAVVDRGSLIVHNL